MSASSAPEPPKVNFALGSILGKTFVSEAAASTVGFPPPSLAEVSEVVPDEVLLPHAESSARPPIASGIKLRRTRRTLTNPNTSSTLLPECWHPNEIMESRSSSPSRMRRRRLAWGLTQSELASRAGVSRQLVAAVEAGHNAPAVDAALGLARALGTTVEDLFSPLRPSVTHALGHGLREHALLRVGRVGESLVSVELADHGTAGTAWAKPDGVFEEGTLRLFPGANPAGLVLAGCDPAIGIAEAMLHGRAGRSMLAISTATGTALKALARGRVHAAVVHGPEQQLPKPPVPVVRLRFARWQVGLASGSRRGRASLEDLLAGNLPIAQRDPAAASQQALDRMLATAGIGGPPPGPRASGHIEAARLAATLDCAALTTETAAAAFALRFIPLEEHAVEVWVAERWQAHPAADALEEVLASPAFTERVARFGGYDLTGCGTRAEPSPAKSQAERFLGGHSAGR